MKKASFASKLMLVGFCLLLGGQTYGIWFGDMIKEGIWNTVVVRPAKAFWLSGPVQMTIWTAIPALIANQYYKHSSEKRSMATLLAGVIGFSAYQMMRGGNLEERINALKEENRVQHRQAQQERNEIKDLVNRRCNELDTKVAGGIEAILEGQNDLAKLVTEKSTQERAGILSRIANRVSSWWSGNSE